MALLILLRALPDALFIAAIFILGMVGWAIVYLLAAAFTHIQKGIVRQNLILRREIAILRRSLGKELNNHRVR